MYVERREEREISYHLLQGDSGGPLFTQHSDTGYSVIGITSWGDGCARPNTLGVYTNLQFYMDWIVNQCGYSGIGPTTTTTQP